MKGRRCWYRGCTHRTRQTSDSTCKMHIFPKDWDTCRLWMRHSGLVGTPRKLPLCRYVCSCHFVGGMGPTAENHFPLPAPGLILEDDERMEDEESVDDPVLPGTPVQARDAVDTVSSSANQNERSPNRTLRDITPVQMLQSSAQNIHSPCHTSREDLHEETSQKVRRLEARIQELEKALKERDERIRNLLTEKSARRMEVDTVVLPDDASFSESDSDLAVPLPPTPDARGTREIRNESTEHVTVAEPSSCRTMRDLQGRHARQDPLSMPARGRSVSPRPSRSRVRSRGGGSVYRNLVHRKPFLSYDNLKSMPSDDFLFLTGLTPKKFEILYGFLGGDDVCEHLKYKYDAATPAREIFKLSMHSARDRLVMTLVRLRRGVPLRDLGYLVNLDESVVSRICYTWIRLMSIEFKSIEEKMFTSAAAQEDNKPDCFKPFPNLRTIIDGTEIYIQKPEHMEQQSNTYSAYKGRNTVKFLVGVSVYGGLSFVSEGFEGGISDKNLFLKSGIMDYLIKDDVIMSDRGFDVESELDDIGCHLVIPAFLEQRSHFTAPELVHSKAVASSRVHVERFIGRVKEFRILRFGIPNAMLPIASDIFRVCACLVNFQEQIIV